MFICPRAGAPPSDLHQPLDAFLDNTNPPLKALNLKRGRRWRRRLGFVSDPRPGPYAPWGSAHSHGTNFIFWFS
ncbi:hypothetical protein J6590_007037 [Homalodisca vitripennis]|nr:hypothetical protein J6590_007037 [Homalodisca vitripennis]